MSNQTQIKKLEAQMYDALDVAESYKEHDMDTFCDIMENDVMPIFYEIRLLETLEQGEQ